ncbi:MAG TPA: alpha-galactosidase [Nocardioidaceae bacterium]|nr:alpha-galactosidase [Nocardioidaceae bacterium]
MSPPTTSTLHLRRGGVSVLLEIFGDRLPAIRHWGADLGDGDLGDLLHTWTGIQAHSALDEPTQVGLLPEYARGHAGRPGLVVRRAGDGSSWAPRFTDCTATASDAEATVHADDHDLGLSLRSTLSVEESGLLRMRNAVTNTGADPLAVAGLEVVVPVPDRAAEVLHLTGRWCRERHPQRQPLHDGALVREGRHGRTGHDATLLMAAGEPGFGFGHGEVWAVHVAWSGDHVAYAERRPESGAVLGGGELLGPDEIVLAPGESYETPWLYATWSDAGLDGASTRLHRWLRARPNHPRRARPVVLNTWEAVYFDHDLDRLRGLADVAAGVGVERFVLDDGWFHGRRDDTRALGDWTVDETVWPDGLGPLIDHVRGLGMEFGLWVEPEMISPDSDVARAHPDWVLRGREDLPPSWRHQQVLDLQVPDAYAHVRDQLMALLDAYEIAFLKWDHNRDLIDVAHAGGPAAHGQTVAVYALFDELRAAHPAVEIESCSSGGARVDLAILERTDRVWASDCNDALERQTIQRWTGLLLPPELVGSHVGPPTAHTTGRTHTLGFRAATALFGHFGIEWDIASASDAERVELAEWIAIYKSERDLLHSGGVVHGDGDDPVSVYGVLADDRARALFAVAALKTSSWSSARPVRLPGLDPARRYRIERIGPAPAYASKGSGWTDDGPVELAGSVLTRVGVVLPILRPETAIVLRLTEV